MNSALSLQVQPRRLAPHNGAVPFQQNSPAFPRTKALKAGRDTPDPPWHQCVLVEWTIRKPAATPIRRTNSDCPAGSRNCHR